MEHMLAAVASNAAGTTTTADTPTEAAPPRSTLPPSADDAAAAAAAAVAPWHGDADTRNADVAAFFELHGDVESTACSAAQTDGTDLPYDTLAQPLKHADSRTIQRCLRRALSRERPTACQGCEELAWLSLEPSNRMAVGAEGGVDVALKVMQRWMGEKRCAAVLLAALAALARLLSEAANVEAFYAHDSALLRRMEETTGYVGGGTVLVAAAMSGYPLRTDMQQEGCALARALAADELHRARFVENGMAGHVLAAMHRHPECAALCCEGLGCFGAFCDGSDEACRWAVSEGVVLDYVAEALEAHAEHSEVARLGAAFVCRVQACAAPADVLAEVRKTMVVPGLLRCCETHGAHEVVARVSVEALVPHVRYFPSRADEFARCVKKVMSCHSDAELLGLCCVVARGLGQAAPTDGARLRLGSHLVPYVSAALHVFEDDELVRAAASGALASLVVNKWATPLGKPRRAQQQRQEAVALPQADVQAQPMPRHVDPGSAAATVVA